MTATDQSLLLRALVDELARAGMREAVTAPGSRNSPIIQALVNDPRLRAFSQIDERCAGFFALGAAKASGRPVAVTVTSGTAVANLLPAVIEAREAGVPLIVISADRPAELRDVGAGQTIDQVKIYGSAPKWFSELDVYEAGAERMRWVRSLACRAYFTALAGRPGPVHLNVPLREPLLPEQPLPADPEGAGGRAGGAPWVTIAGEQPPQTLEAPASKRPLLVAGEGAGASVSRLGIPVLADPLSGARSGASAIAYYDLILRSPKARAELRPDAIYRVGGLPTSKPLRNWLAELQEVPQIQLASGGAWIDPAATVRARHDGLPAGIGASPEWLDSWRGG
ncbi:MAG: 2-succinyl-5-enolpyruvyl-6-hydroxy-3-cyclohexene-1-carboxylic-acid synthase, partial [Solirubrobacterales bacterium]|nr:2-succinyl-5-enolpyruvyl-6-hydroxy-3-cyclohexene-1-carboxylic-acid synthase [Solirubrobacterales bacterium]